MTRHDELLEFSRALGQVNRLMRHALFELERTAFAPVTIDARMIAVRNTLRLAFAWYYGAQVVLDELLLAEAGDELACSECEVPHLTPSPVERCSPTSPPGEG